MAKRYNIPQYAKNLGRSSRKMTQNVLRSQMPVISDTVVSSAESIKEFRRLILTSRAGMRTGNKLQDTVFKPVKELLNNAKEDLKSGKLYNEERELQSYSGMGDLMDSMFADDEPSVPGGIDTSAFDKVLQSSTASAMATTKSGNLIAQNASQNAEYLGQLSNIQHNQHMMMATKNHMEVMKGLGNLQKIGMSIVEFNMKTATDFFDRSLKTQNDQLSEMRAIRELLNEQLELTASTRINKNAQKGAPRSIAEYIFNPNGSINLRGFIDNAKNNAISRIPVSKDLLKLGFDTVKSNPIATVLEFLMSSAIPKSAKKSMNRLDDSVAGMFANLMGTLNGWRNGKGNKGWKRTLGSIFGFDKQNISPDLSLYKNQELNADLELKKAKAITEVIPSYLSEILKFISGTDKSYNYSTGKFIDNERIRRSRIEERHSMAESAAYRSSNTARNKITVFSKDMTSEQREVLRYDMGEVHIWLMMTDDPPGKYTYAQALKNGLNPLENGEASYNMIIAAYKAVPKSQLNIDRQQFAVNMLQYNHMQTMDMVKSGEIAAFNGLSDSRTLSGMMNRKNPYATVNPPRGSYGQYDNISVREADTKIRTSRISDNDRLETEEEKNKRKEKDSFKTSKIPMPKIVDTVKNSVNDRLEKVFGENSVFGHFMQSATNLVDAMNEPDFFDRAVDDVEYRNSYVNRAQTEARSNIRHAEYVAYTGKKRRNKAKGKARAKEMAIQRARERASRDQAQINSVSQELGVSSGASTDSSGDDGGDGDPGGSDGLHSKEIFNLFKSYLPKVAIGGAAGGIIGKLLKNHPFVGAIAGAGLNVLFASSKVQSILFGDPKNKDDKGLFGDLKDNIKESVIGPLKSMMDPFNQMIQDKFVNPVADWMKRKTDGLKDFLSDKFGFKFSGKKTEEQTFREKVLEKMDDISNATKQNSDATAEEANKVSETIEEALNPDPEKHSKFSDIFNKTLDKIKTGGAKGLSAGKGALVSSLLGLGPVPGAIFGAIFGGRKKKNKNEKQDEKDSKELDKQLDEADKENKTSGSYKKMSVLMSSGLSSLLGLGPIPGALFASIVNNRRKKKANKAQDKKAAKDLQEGVEEQQNAGKKGGVRRFFGKRKNEILGAAASSLLGMGPIPGYLLARIYNKKRYKNAKDDKEQQDDANTIATDNTGIWGKIKNKASGVVNGVKDKFTKAEQRREESKAAKRAKEEQSLSKKFIQNVVNGKADENQDLVKNYMNSADTEEELKSAERMSTIAANITQQANGIAVAQEKKSGGLIDTIKNVVSNLGSILPLALGAIAAYFGLKDGDLNLSNGVGIASTVAATKIGGIKAGSAVGYTARAITNAATGNTANAVADAGKATASVVKTVALKNMLKNLANNGIVKKLIGEKLAKKLAGNADKIAAHVAKEAAEGAAKQSAKVGAKAIPYVGLAIAATQAVWGFISGWNDVRNTLHTSQTYNPPVSLKITSAIIKAIDDATLGILDLLGLRDTVIKFVYKIFANEEDELVLENAQNEQKSNYYQFMRENPGSELSFSKYNDITNKTTWRKMVDWGKGLFGKKAETLDDYRTSNVTTDNSVTSIDNSQNTYIVTNSAYSGGSRGSVTGTLSKITKKLSNIGGSNSKIIDIRGATKALDQLGPHSPLLTGNSDYINSLYNELGLYGSGARGPSTGDIVRGVKNNLSRSVYRADSKMDEYKNSSTDTYDNISEASKKKPSLLSKIGNGIKNVASKVWNGITNIGSKAKNGIKNAYNRVVSWITGSGARGYDPDYYSQFDPRWGNMSFGKYDGHRDTVADGGCGPTVAAMALQKLTGQKITPDIMARLAMSSGMKYDDGGTDPAFFNTAGSKYGISFDENIGVNDNAIKSLRSGNPVVFMGSDRTGTSPFGSGSHYVLGTGLDSKGNVNILDPQNPINNRKYNIKDLAASTTNVMTPRGRGKNIKYRRGRFGRGEPTDEQKLVVQEALNRKGDKTFRAGDMTAGGAKTGSVSGKCMAWVAAVYYKALGKKVSFSKPNEAIKSPKFVEGFNNIPLGALVLFHSTPGVGDGTSGHVGIYVGNGMMVHAYPSGVIESSIEDINNTYKNSQHGWYAGWFSNTSSLSTDSGSWTPSVSSSSNPSSGGNKLSSTLSLVSNMFSSNALSSSLNVLSSLFGDGSSSSSSSGTGTSSLSLEESERANAIYKELIKSGFSHEGAIAILANMKSESPGFSTESIGDKGTSYGLCQWHNSRWDSLKQYCSDNGYAVNSIEGQVAYLTHEMKQYGLYDKFTKSGGGVSSAKSLADIFVRQFEKPKYVDSESTKRQGNVDSLYSISGSGARGASLVPRIPNRLRTRGVSLISPNIPDRMSNDLNASSVMNSSGVNLVKNALDKKNSLISSNNASLIKQNSTQSGPSQNVQLDTTSIVNALNVIIQLLTSIDKSNETISNKNPVNNSAVIPVGSSQQIVPQASYNNKQSLISAIVSGI